MAAVETAERHLLVVDDDDRIRDLLKQYLTRHGFRVTTAPGGAHARKGEFAGMNDVEVLAYLTVLPA